MKGASSVYDRLSKLTPIQLLRKAKVTIRDSHPFFSYLLAYLLFIEDESVKTAAVDGSNRCYYAPKFIENLSSNVLDKGRMVVGLVTHEVLHLAMKHPLRRGNRNIVLRGTEAGTCSLWNAVCDFIINNAILLERNIKLPDGALLPDLDSNGVPTDSFTFCGIQVTNLSKKSAEDIYSELAGQLKRNESPQSGDEKSSGKGSSSGDSSGNQDNNDDQEDDGDESNQDVIHVSGNIPEIDNHDRWGKKPVKSKDAEEGEGEGESDDNQFDTGELDWDQVLQGATVFAKNQGKLPGGLQREFEVLNKSKINWKAILRREITKALPFDFTYDRPNKKFAWADMYMPSFQGEQVKIVILIDTSGSIGKDEMTMFVSELVAISRSFSNVEFRVITHDVPVHNDWHITGQTEKQIRDIKPEGGGGTSHIPAFNYLKEKKYMRDANLCISFTDGYSDFPDKKPLETLFVLGGGHVPKEKMPKWAKTICIK